MHSWKHRQKFQVWKKCTSSQDFILISARVMRDFHGSDSILLRILRETCGFKQTSRILRQERVNIWWAFREINFTVTSESRRKTSRQHHPFLSLILSLSVNAPSDSWWQHEELPATQATCKSHRNSTLQTSKMHLDLPMCLNGFNVHFRVWLPDHDLSCRKPITMSRHKSGINEAPIKSYSSATQPECNLDFKDCARLRIWRPQQVS